MTIREKTDQLNDGLLDKQMSDNLLSLAWWAEVKNSLESLVELLDFLKIKAVSLLLREKDEPTYNSLVNELEEKIG